MSKTQLIFLLAISLILLIAITGCERKVTDRITEAVEAPEFIGSDACQSCHSDIYANFIKSGHPYKLNKVSGAAPTYPYSSVPNPPSGYTWDDITYVIGGYGWKARFIGTDGYIITAGGNNQYNLVDGSWSDYHKDEVKPYNCGSCHTTGFDSDSTKHQDNLPGIIGSWAFPGIQCEACHGPGSLHADAPLQVQMKIDRSAASCGECHIRGDVGKIPASGNFIRHHEQYNELMSTTMASLRCVDCHDPHISTRYTPDEAIVLECESCHWDEEVALENSELPHYNNGIECTDCHMPDADKSALAAGTYEGDLPSHLFAINTDSTAEMIYSEGGSDWANPYLTLEYTCLKSGCHSSETKGWAARHADEVHGD